MSLDVVTSSAPAEPIPQPSAPAPAISEQPAAPVTATQNIGSAPAPTQQASEGMVPSYRIRETREQAIREAQSQWQAREAEYAARIDQVQRQLHALVGVAPDVNPEETAVRNQFGKLYPGLAQLEQRAQDLLGVVDRSGDLENQNKHYWTEYGRQRTDRLFENASKSLGAPLSAEGKKALLSAFYGFVSSSPEIQERYQQDPTLVDEYWSYFANNFIEPVRRSASATVENQVTQRQIPRDTPGGIPQVTAPPKPKNLDERMENAWAQYNLTKR